MNEEQELKEQRAKAQAILNKLLDDNKRVKELNKIFLDSLIEPEEIIAPTEYSDIKINSLTNIEFVVPKANEKYWNLVIIDRKVLQDRLKECRSQYMFEILLRDYNNSFNKLTDKEKEIYLS